MTWYHKYLYVDDDDDDDGDDDENRYKTYKLYKMSMNFTENRYVKYRFVCNYTNIHLTHSYKKILLYVQL